MTPYQFESIKLIRKWYPDIQLAKARDIMAHVEGIIAMYAKAEHERRRNIDAIHTLEHEATLNERAS